MHSNMSVTDISERDTERECGCVCVCDGERERKERENERERECERELGRIIEWVKLPHTNIWSTSDVALTYIQHNFISQTWYRRCFDNNCFRAIKYYSAL